LKADQWYLEHLLAGREYLSDAYYRSLTQVETNE